MEASGDVAKMTSLQHLIKRRYKEMPRCKDLVFATSSDIFIELYSYARVTSDSDIVRCCNDVIMSTEKQI